MPLRGQLPPIKSTTSRPAALTHPPSNALVGALEYRTETETTLLLLDTNLTVSFRFQNPSLSFFLNKMSAKQNGWLIG